MTLFALLALLATQPDTACDCSIYPFKPKVPCREQCNAVLIGNFDDGTASLIFGLTAEGADKLKAAQSGGVNFKELRSILNREDWKRLNRGLDSLTEHQFYYLSLSPDERGQYVAGGELDLEGAGLKYRRVYGERD